MDKHLRNKASLLELEKEKKKAVPVINVSDCQMYWTEDAVAMLTQHNNSTIDLK